MEIKSYSDMALPHFETQSFEHLKTELVKQGRAYAKQALTYRTKIAELLLGFIKDDSVVRAACFLLSPSPYSNLHLQIRTMGNLILLFVSFR